MADDMNTFCSYCGSQHTQFDYALHRVSNVHVKKVQRNLVNRGFASTCLVCNFALKDLKQAELHVQEKTHMDRMKSFLVDSYLSNDKCTCGSCGITFFSEVVLEAHRLLPSHDSTTSALHTPKLDELSRLLSGSSERQFIPNCNSLCSVCDVTFDCIENSIMHLFTPAHISRLRSSSCMVCKKEFTHASDRELHVNSSKHQIALRRCSNLLEEGRTQALLSKGGYPCMLCMIWCNSWFCLELHLLDKHHVKMAAQSKANCPISARIVFSATLEGIEQSAGCDESTMSSWREWRGEASGECAWCHRCGVWLLNVDEVNKHLNKHSVDRGLATSRSHSSKFLDSDSVSEIFKCSVCVVSFKNAFMLSVHEASFQHHSRLAACCLTNDVQCCGNCGLLMYEGDGNGASACKDVKGSLPQMNRAEVSPKCPQLTQHPFSAYDTVKKTSNIRGLGTIMQATSSTEGAHQTSVVTDKVGTDYIEAKSFLVADQRDNSLKVGLAPGSGEPSVSTSDKTGRDEEGVDRVLIANDLLMNESFCKVNTCHDDNVSSQSGGSQSSLIPKTGCMSINIVADGNGMVAGKSGTTMPSNAAANENDIEPDKAHTNGLLSEVPPSNVVANSPTLHGHLRLACANLDNSFTQQKPVLLAGQVSDGDGSESAKKAKFAVPIVVAATLAPLGTLQESLQSITTIVTESLSSALSTFYMQQSTPLSKRKSQSGAEEEAFDQPEVKRMRSERILETALRRGLQSVCSNATTLKDLDVKCQADTEKARNSIGDDKDVQEPQAVIAVAASIFPNGLRDSSRPAGVQGQVEANKAQESSAMQSGDDSNKRAQESTDFKSESLSQVVVGNQASAGSTKGKTVVEEKLTHLDISPTLPSSALLCTSTQNVITSIPVFSLANGAMNSMKDEVCLPAKKLTAPMGVVASRVSEESESNDEDDYYTFLDPTKGQGKWWSSSDSEDSDSVSK